MAGEMRGTFLGREFLTWLWFESERSGGTVNSEQFGAVRVDFGQRLSLQSTSGAREGSTVKAEAPGETEEARSALRTGKQVTTARLFVATADREFWLSIDADTFTFSGVKLPSVLGGKDDNKVDERLLLLDELEGVVDELYMIFIKLRADPQAWPDIREGIHQWVLAQPTA